MAIPTIAALDRRFYSDYIDEHARFDACIRRHLRPGMDVLDAGAGRGIRYPYDYGRIASRVAGVDVDPAVLDNVNLTDAAVADLAALPYPNGAFDLVFSKYVFEHLEYPLPVLRELRRVMRPGAHLLVHTPNRWHYVALSARITPLRFHVWFNERRGRVEADTFPTCYRVNDVRSIPRLAARSGFQVADLEQIETKPDYLAFHPIPYLAGIAYERLVNRSQRFGCIRVQLIVDLRAV